MKQWYRKSQRDLCIGTDTKPIWKFSLIKDIAKIEIETEGWNDSKSGVLSARKKKQSHSIARYRSKVKRQIILHLENKNVVILYPPYGTYESVKTHLVLAIGKNIMEKPLAKNDWKAPFPFFSLIIWHLWVWYRFRLEPPKNITLSVSSVRQYLSVGRCCKAS